MSHPSQLSQKLRYFHPHVLMRLVKSKCLHWNSPPLGSEWSPPPTRTTSYPWRPVRWWQQELAAFFAEMWDYSPERECPPCLTQLSSQQYQGTAPPSQQPRMEPADLPCLSPLSGSLGHQTLLPTCVWGRGGMFCPLIWTVCLSFQPRSNQPPFLRLGKTRHSCVGLSFCPRVRLIRTVPLCGLYLCPLQSPSCSDGPSISWPPSPVFPHLMAGLKLGHKTTRSACRDIHHADQDSL